MAELKSVMSQSNCQGPGCRVSSDTISARIEVLHKDVVDMKAIIKELTCAIVRLTLMEERIAVTMTNLERAFKAIEGMDGRVAEIEKQIPEYSRMSLWIERVLWASTAAFAMYILHRVGIIT